MTIVVAPRAVPSTKDDVPPISGRTAMPVAVPETVGDPEKVHIVVQAAAVEILNVFEVTTHAYRMVVLNVDVAATFPVVRPQPPTMDKEDPTP